MKKQTVFLLFGTDGTPNFAHCSYHRKSVRDSFIRLFPCDTKHGKWKYWYDLGYRIKKVELTIKVL
jgi:hypothetical protein